MRWFKFVSSNTCTEDQVINIVFKSFMPLEPAVVTSFCNIQTITFTVLHWDFVISQTYLPSMGVLEMGQECPVPLLWPLFRREDFLLSYIFLREIDPLERYNYLLSKFYLKKKKKEYIINKGVAFLASVLNY